jgi:hypothetical protein
VLKFLKMRRSGQFAIWVLAGLLLALLGAAQVRAQSLLADFDGDHKLDRADLVSRGLHKSIRIDLSGSGPQYLRFDSESLDAGQLLIRDINHDDNPDLIWVSQAAPQSAMVWLGDGRGHFAFVANAGAYRSELHGLLCGTTDSNVSGAAIKRSACAAGPSYPVALVLSRCFITVAPHLSIRAGRERGTNIADWLARLYERGPPPNTLL